MYNFIVSAAACAQTLVVSEAQSSSVAQSMTRAWMFLWLTLSCLVGNSSSLDPIFFVGACIARCTMVLPLLAFGILFARQAALAFLIVGIKPAWEMCEDITNVFRRRLLRRKGEKKEVAKVKTRGLLCGQPTQFEW